MHCRYSSVCPGAWNRFTTSAAASRAQSLLHGARVQNAEQFLGREGPYTFAESPRNTSEGFPAAATRLHQARLAGPELDSVRARLHQRFDGARQILDARQKLGIVKHAVIERYVEAFAIRGEEAV